MMKRVRQLTLVWTKKKTFKRVECSCVPYAICFGCSNLETSVGTNAGNGAEI